MQKRFEKKLSLEELAKLEDNEIDTSDIPELDERFWENAVIVRPEEPNKSSGA